MSYRLPSLLLLVALVTLVATGSSLLTARVVAAPPGAPAGTAIPFQGFLQENGVTVSGQRDFSFSLFDAETGGSAIGSPVTRNGLQVTNGLYAADVDFGAAAWTTGEARWIQVTVNGTPLLPRTRVFPAPQAIYASQAGSAGTAATATSATQLAGIPAAQFGRLYGDGSAGAFVAPPGSSVFQDLVPDGNFSFTNVTIPAGATLLVRAGTTIRCTGTFTVEAGGTLQVGQVFPAGVFGFDGQWSAGLLELPPVQGIGSSGGPGQPGAPGTARTGGVGGIPTLNPQGVLDPSLGGGGVAVVTAAPNTFPQTAAGGGAILIRCAGPVVNQGLILARGFDGGDSGGPSPGAGGGAVLIGSATSITSTAGTINARGGNGSAANTRFGRGGGGGGGLVRLVAPVIDAPDSQINVTGGTVGGAATVDNATGTRGGGGGGGSCGAGGRGSSLSAANVEGANGAEPGQPGCIIRTIANPQAVWD